MKIDLFAKCWSAEVRWTIEAGIAEIGVASKLRTTKIGESQEIAWYKIGRSMKRRVIEGGINSEIGLSEGCTCKEIAFNKLH